jgi:hypothetical protein
MTNTKVRKQILLVLGIAALASYAWAQDTGQPVVKTQVQNVDATIKAINPDTREVTLEGEKGPLTVQVDKEVKNFDNMKVGDKVRVSYYQGLAAQLAKPGSKPVNAAGSTFGYTAKPGAMPGAGAGASVTSTVVINAIDLPSNTVAFTRPDGTTHIIQVRSENGRQFIRTLKPGDRVDVTYTESLAINVIPVNR